MILSEDPTISGDIYSLLYELGGAATNTCFLHTAYAVRLAAEQPQKLLYVTKWLYPEVAKHYKTTWHAVERNIRRFIKTVWETHPERLEALAGRSLGMRPTPAQFLTILSRRLHGDDAA